MAIVELDTTKRKLKTLCHLQEYKEKNPSENSKRTSPK